LLILATDGLYLVYTEEKVAQMIAMLRQKGKSLNEISQLITDECCTDYNCKDNVTLIIIDLKKHYNDFQKQVRE